ncbi:MAG: hypothetical protein ABIT09_02345 [Croceibacterium sp.]
MAGWPAWAQETPAEAALGPPVDAPDATADQIAEAARQSLKAPGTRQLCQAAKGNEIVVCAQDPERLRVPSSTDEGTNISDGLPRAPDLFGIPSGGVIVAKGCFFPPCPRKMPPLIDLKAIPEAPPGSAAARFKEAADERVKAAPTN